MNAEKQTNEQLLQILQHKVANTVLLSYPFSALTPLVGWQKWHPAP